MSNNYRRPLFFDRCKVYLTILKNKSGINEPTCPGNKSVFWKVNKNSNSISKQILFFKNSYMAAHIASCIARTACK
jgi:hypothetical protein